MKFQSRFQVGDTVFVDATECYADLFQKKPRKNGFVSTSGNYHKALKLRDGSHVIGVTLMEVPVAEVHVAADIQRTDPPEKRTSYTFRGTSSRGELRVWKTKEEAEYYASKYYLNRIQHCINNCKKVLRKTRNLRPSQVQHWKTQLSAFEKVKAEAKKNVGVKPKVKIVRNDCMESKYNLGQLVWVFPHSDNTNNLTHINLNEDYYLQDMMHSVKFWLNCLTETPKQRIIDAVRNNCLFEEENKVGVRFRYGLNGRTYFNEYDEHCLFLSKEEALKFGKKYVFLNRKPCEKAQVVKQLTRKIEQLIAGDISENCKTFLKQTLRKLKAVKVA